MLYIPFNNFQSCPDTFLSLTSAKQRIKCLAQGHNTVPPVSLKLRDPLTPSLTFYQLSHNALLIPICIMVAYIVNNMNSDQTAPIRVHSVCIYDKSIQCYVADVIR